MVNPDSYTENEGIREVDVTIYDDYPIYLMENAREMQGLEDPTSITHTQSNIPGSNKFNSNEYFRADTFKPADPGSAPKPNVGDTSSRG